MSFDDRVREALEREGAVHQPAVPAGDELLANVNRRQRMRLAIGGGAVAALVLVIGLAVALPRDTTPQARLDASGPPAGSANEGQGGTTTTTTTTPASGPSTSAPTGGTIAPSGTAYSPPGSVVHPGAVTTTIPKSTTTTAAPSGDTVMVTQDDNGKTFTLRPGQHLVVSLSDASWTWSEPDTDNAKVLERTAVSANPSATQVTASFAAKQAGQAHVSASKDAPCRNSNPPCMIATQLWQITVNVA